MTPATVAVHGSQRPAFSPLTPSQCQPPAAVYQATQPRVEIGRRPGGEVGLGQVDRRGRTAGGRRSRSPSPSTSRRPAVSENGSRSRAPPWRTVAVAATVLRRATFPAILLGERQPRRRAAAGAAVAGACDVPAAAALPRHAQRPVGLAGEPRERPLGTVEGDGAPFSRPGPAGRGHRHRGAGRHELGRGARRCGQIGARCRAAGLAARAAPAPPRRGRPRRRRRPRRAGSSERTCMPPGTQRSTRITS